MLLRQGRAAVQSTRSFSNLIKAETKLREVDPALIHPDLSAPPLEQSVLGKLFSKVKTPSVSLASRYPGAPALLEPLAGVSEQATVTTVNGIKVATLPSNSPVAHVGVYVDTGSRYETRETVGITQFLEMLACKSTQNRTDFRLVREMGRLGGNIVASSSRDQFTYSGDVLREYVPHLLGSFADLMQNHLYQASEVEAMCEWAHKQAKARNVRADIGLTDALHEAAYSGKTLGAPFYPTHHSVESFTTDVLKSWVHEHFANDKLTVAAVGVDHATLEAQVAEYFTKLTPNGPDAEPAKYTGGEVRVNRRGEAGVDGLSHFALAFEAANWTDKDLVPLCVLQMLMGGGGSFSAGGPGKGMYSRLYENVLNVHGWVENVQSFAHVYSDAGLFGFTGVSQPDDSESMVEVLVAEAHRMTGPVTQVELARARNLLKSSLLMQLESKSLQLEDLGKQVSTYGKYITPSEQIVAIDAVSEDDIRRIASKMLKSKPTLAFWGDTSTFPSYDEITKSFK